MAIRPPRKPGMIIDPAGVRKPVAKPSGKKAAPRPKPVRGAAGPKVTGGKQATPRTPYSPNYSPKPTSRRRTY